MLDHNSDSPAWKDVSVSEIVPVEELTQALDGRGYRVEADALSHAHEKRLRILFFQRMNDPIRRSEPVGCSIVLLCAGAFFAFLVAAPLRGKSSLAGPLELACCEGGGSILLLLSLLGMALQGIGSAMKQRAYRESLAAPGSAFQENLEALSRLLSESEPADRLLKAEVLRTLGRFDEAVALLSEDFLKSLWWSLDDRFAGEEIRRLARAGQRWVAEINIPGRKKIELKA